MTHKKSPNYKIIYTDIINDEYPHKKEECSKIINKSVLTYLDIITLNTLIFEKSQSFTENQKHKGYSEDEILYMLDFQKKNNLNNSQLANHFKLSRNSVTKWKKIFI